MAGTWERTLAAIVSVVTTQPRAPEHDKELLTAHPDLVHLTVEVHRCAGGELTPAVA